MKKNIDGSVEEKIFRPAKKLHTNPNSNPIHPLAGGGIATAAVMKRNANQDLANNASTDESRIIHPLAGGGIAASAAAMKRVDDNGTGNDVAKAHPPIGGRFDYCSSHYQARC